MESLFEMPASAPERQPAVGETTICEHCGNERYWRPSEARRRKSPSRYCSNACRIAARPTAKCETCGETFSVYPSLVKYGAMRFCKLACWHAYNRGERAVRFNSVERVCAGCGVVMRRPPSHISTTGVYCCSYECVGKVRRGKTSPLKQPREVVKCACGKMFEARPAFGSRSGHQKELQKFCSHACAADSMRIATDYVYGPDWPRQRRRALRRDKSTCQDCGGREGIEVHHLEPKRRRGSNALSNLRTLCRQCHKRADALLAREDRDRHRQLVLIPRPRTGRRPHSARRKETVTT